MQKCKISELLQQLIDKPHTGRFSTYGELVQTVGEQAYGLIIILFALPNALPIAVIPGFSFLFGLPIIFIAFHIIFARPNLWLPKVLANRTIETNKLKQVINKARPYLLTVERLLKPRWLFFSSPIVERFHGLVLLGLSILLLLPIPFSNFIFACLIILFGLGISEKDGLVLAIAYLGTIFYFFFLTSLTRGLLHWLF